MFPFHFHLCLLSLFFLSPLLTNLLLVCGAATNVSIDDTNGDPNTGAQIMYDPSRAWQAGQSCTNCTARPDVSQTYDGTWHDATYNPPGGVSNVYPGTVVSATVEFTGTAVYIYCILTGSSSSPDGNTDMAFYIDDLNNAIGTFNQTPNGDTTYQYNQLVFAHGGLDGSTNHTVKLESGYAGSTQKALVLLDRIDYTTDDSQTTTAGIGASPTSSSSSSQSSSTSTSSSSASSAQQTTSSPSSSSSSSSSSPSSTTISPLTLAPSSSSVTSGTSESGHSTNTMTLPSLTVTSKPSSSSNSTGSSSDSGSSSTNTGTIVGATVGSVGGLCLVVGLWWICAARRRRRLKEEDEAARAVQPFFPSQSRYAGATSSGYGFGTRGGVSDGAGNDEETTSRRETYFTLPAFPGTGAGTGPQTKGSTTLTSPISPTSFKTPNTVAPYTLSSPYSPAEPRMKYAAAMAAGGLAGDGREAERREVEHSYAVNVRSEKMRLFANQNNHQTRNRNRSQNQGRGMISKVSPFSPIPLYGPTQQGGLGTEDALSPSTASATATLTAGGSASASASRTHVDGSRVGVRGGRESEDENERENRIRLWNSTGRVHGEDVDTVFEPVTPFTILRPNRRREPAPLDDDLESPSPPPPPPPPPATHTHPTPQPTLPSTRPPRPSRSPHRPSRVHTRPLTRISETFHLSSSHNNNDNDDQPEVSAEARAEGGRGGDAESDEGSDVRWQKKLVSLFTPSSSLAGGKRGSLPKSPGPPPPYHSRSGRS